MSGDKPETAWATIKMALIECTCGEHVQRSNFDSAVRWTCPECLAVWETPSGVELTKAERETA